MISGLVLKRCLPGLLALALSACSTMAPVERPGQAAQNLQLIDLTDDAIQTWERSAALPDAGRVAAFKAHFATILPGFYSHERLRLPGPERYDARLLERLRALPGERAGIEEVSRRFASMLAPAQASFERALGPMRGYPPIYLVHSFGEFDGGMRTLPGGTFLMFGADMIARFHLRHDIRPFFHHELFHLYHNRSFAGCDAIWCGLWTEGLATYVASRLNPDASDAELLLTVPEPIRAEVDANRQEAICAVASRLDSTEPADSRALFSFRRLNPRLPPRFGYYVGYLMATELGRTRSLRELAAMNGDQIRALLRQTLGNLATCPG